MECTIEMLNNIYGAYGPCIAEAKMFFSQILFAKLLWTLRKMLKFHLNYGPKTLTKNRTRICELTKLNTTVTC